MYRYNIYVLLYARRRQASYNIMYIYLAVTCYCIIARGYS